MGPRQLPGRAVHIRVHLLLDVRQRRDVRTRKILGQVDLAPIVEELPPEGASAVFCVERDSEACHLSIIAERMATQHDVVVSHLRP